MKVLFQIQSGSFKQVYLIFIFKFITRFIIFPVSQDFFSNLPPAITFPEDDIWEVFVTIVRYLITMVITSYFFSMILGPVRILASG